MTGIPVLAARHLDPGAGRIDMTLPEGLTLAEVVAAALPGALEADLDHVRVALVSPQGSALVLRSKWASVRPKPGVRVVIRVIPGKNALRSILSIVVSIAAIAIGGWFAGSIMGYAAGTTAYAIAQAGAAIAVNLVGNLLINALIPPVKPDEEKRRNTYSITGWRNRLEPDGAVPVVLGAIRYAPPFAAMSWTEIGGDWQYIRALFCFGEGPLDLTDFRIGETSISEFDEVDLEVRQGLPGDLPCTLYPRQIVEETIGVELTRPLPRNDLGEVISGPSIEAPVVRTTGDDASGASVLLAFPGGLIRYNDEGKKRGQTVEVRIEQRLVEAEAWSLVATLKITAKKAETFYRQHSWEFPSRGRYQVRLTMLTAETDDSKVQQRCAWAALQTLRPEYPIDYPRPLSLVAVRVKATHQLNGALDNFSAVASRICLDWDHVTGTWVSRATRNPASLFRYVLQAPSNPKRSGNAGIDLTLLQDWHDFCRLKGLEFRGVLDQTGTTLRDVLTEIAAAGRARPRHDGVRWGVIIDRPQDLVVDHISPRNSWDFRISRTYAEKPHAIAVSFLDETNDFKPSKRVVRRPGYVGEIELTEALDMPGITNPDIVWRETIRRFFEVDHRPDVYTVIQEGSISAVTRGDLVMLSHDVLTNSQKAVRVVAVEGNQLLLDDIVSMDPETAYGIRFRSYADAEDAIGTSVVRLLETLGGETDILTLVGDGALPEPDDLLLFGEAGIEAFPAIVTGIEATEDQCRIIRSVDAAPEIDALTDAAEIPTWSGRVGAEIDANILQPSAPRLTSITSGRDGTDEADDIDYLIEPGPGVIVAASFVVEHKLAAAAVWTVITLPVANGGGSITGYSNGQPILIRAKAISATGVTGPYGPTIHLTVGAGDADIPAPLDPEAVTVTTLLGGALVQLATGADDSTTAIQIYRSTSAVLDRETDAVGAPMTVSPLSSYSFALGDTTRSNLIVNGGFDGGAGWTTGAGWTVAGGVATHTPGVASAIGQPFAATSGKWYRFGIGVDGRSAGSVTPRLTGGSERAGTAVSADGSFADRIQAVTGNDTFEVAADSAFDGSIDNIAAYLETAACLSQGTHYVWLEPRNSDGAPGPVSGPFVIQII